MSVTDDLRNWAEGSALCAGMSLSTVRDQVFAFADSIDKDVDQLKAENAKLRELLQNTFIQPDHYCDKYGIEYEDRADAWVKTNYDIDKRLRELGIEVD